MRMFDVQGIEIHAPRSKVLEFLREPENLPRWAGAFQRVDDEHARLETPAGSVDIRLVTAAEPNTGTVDWRLEFPDGSIGLAHSRVTETTRGTCVYSFVLNAPPVPLEQLEGALDAQRLTLANELSTLKSILEG